MTLKQNMLQTDAEKDKKNYQEPRKKASVLRTESENENL